MIHIKTRVLCWNLKHCNNTSCPVFGDRDAVCWLLMMEEGEHRNLTKFFESCWHCPVFEKHRIRSVGLRNSDAYMAETVHTFSEEIPQSIKKLDEIDHELERKDYELRLLYEVSNFLLETIDVEKIVHIILTSVTAQQALGFNRAFLLFVDEESGRVIGHRAIGPSSREEAGRIWSQLESKSASIQDLINSTVAEEVDAHVNELVRSIEIPLANANSVISQAIHQKKAYCVDRSSTGLSGEDHALLAHLETDHTAIVPMTAYGIVIGVLLVDNLFTGRPITHSDLRLLQLFANEASLSIEKARLYEQLKNKIGELNETNEALRIHQEKLIRVERLAAVGEVVANIAHEIRTPLVTIGGMARLMSRRMREKTGSRENPEPGGDDKLRSNLTVISEEVSRLEKILSGILAYSASSQLNLEKFCLNDLILDVIGFLKHRIQALGCDYTLSLDENLPDLEADRYQIRQVLIDILENAFEAMDDKGSFHISTTGVDNGKKLISVKINDSGRGIREEDIDKIFLPFFTTSSTRSGLGLAICHNIIKGHGGTINVTSEQGRGTRFELLLPLHPVA